jgi:hypothetical protein
LCGSISRWTIAVSPSDGFSYPSVQQHNCQLSDDFC